MKLYIISNRLPVKVTSADGTFSFVRSEGGLTTGLNSLQISYEKHWIGWPGLCVDKEEEKLEITSELDKMNFHPVFLTKVIVTVQSGLSVTIFMPIHCIRNLSGKLIKR